MKVRFLIPLALFVMVAGLFYYALQLMQEGEYNPRDIPSPLIGKAVPQFSLPRLLEPGKTLSRADLIKQPVALFNVWASWCVACRDEAAFLLRLSRTGEVPIYGLNYKDTRANAIDFLHNYGNPYTANAFDKNGRVGIDWGVYGVPETFVVDGSGVIRYKQIGPLNERIWVQKVLPLIEKIKAEHKSL